MDSTSPYDDFLATNFAPPPQVLSEVRGILEGKQSRLEWLEARIREFEAERKELDAYITKHKRLLNYLPALSSSEPFSNTQPIQASLLLTRVCRSWRDIALSSPHLWSSIHIHVPSHVNFAVEEFYYEFLEDRGKALGVGWGELDPHYRSHSRFMLHPTWAMVSLLPEYVVELDSYAEMLTKYYHRWSNISFRIPPPAFDLVRPRLADADNSYSNPTRWIHGTHSLCSIFLASSLTVVHLAELPRSVNVSLLPIPWRNLTEICIGSVGRDGRGLTSSNAVELLSRCGQRLKRCSSKIENFVGERYTHPNLHALPHLEDLLLSFDNSKDPNNSLEYIINTILAPKLAHLTLHSNSTIASRHEAVQARAIQSLLQRSACKVVSLFVRLHISSSSLLDCLRLMPDQARREVAEFNPSSSDSTPDASLFYSLISLHERHLPCIEIHSPTRLREQSYFCLIGFLQSRRAQLKVLKVAFRDALDALDGYTSHQLDHLRSCGVKVEWRAPSLPLTKANPLYTNTTTRGGFFNPSYDPIFEPRPTVNDDRPPSVVVDDAWTGVDEESDEQAGMITY
ncbi:hypothetical protein VNI00_009876 [Paramarasmius palmivorus]|uniref:F-box domain-containing protein n=1 Tax=Paramarasmius palmivorus TaxID=297713 RepID=A0AAW0CNG3_9AGAR